MEQSISAPLLPEARILLVDDEPHVLLALGRGLRLKGYNYVDEARSGQEALDKLTRLPYDLMMLDIRMPGMDGLEVLQKAQALRPNLLVVILTGHAALDSAVAALKSGMVVDYLLKPASLEQVDSAIHKALRKRVAEIQQRHSLEAAIAALEQLKSDSPVPQTKPAALPAERFQYAGPFSLDREKRTLTLNDDMQTRSITLTQSEESILALLMAHPGDVLSSRRIAREAMNYDLSESEAKTIVHPHIVRLRRKLEKDPKRPAFIRTVRGRGYLLALPPPTPSGG